MNNRRFNRFMLGLAIWYVWWILFHAIAPMYAQTMDEWLMLRADLHTILQAPWTLFTYPLIPAGSFISVLFSMLFLYFSGRMLFDLIGDRYLPVSLLFGILFPSVLAVLFLSWWKPAMGFTLYGISLYTTVILAAAITYMPKMPVHLFGIIRIPLYAIGIIHLASSIISYPALGFILTLLASAGLGYGMVRFIRGDISLPSVSTPSRRPVLRKHPASMQYDEEELNRILDKIRSQGIGSLSADEKAFLDRFST